MLPDYDRADRIGVTGKSLRLADVRPLVTIVLRVSSADAARVPTAVAVANEGGVLSALRAGSRRD
jgi:hypothetical protein